MVLTVPIIKSLIGGSWKDNSPGAFFYLMVARDGDTIRYKELSDTLCDRGISMFSKFRVAIILIVQIAGLWPVIVDYILTTKYAYYQELNDKYECRPAYPWNLWNHPMKECLGDFDGDGKAGAVVLKNYGRDTFSGELEIIDSKTILSRMSFIAHGRDEMVYLAIHNEFNRARLIVLDEISGTTPVVGVFAWNGGGLTEVPPSPIEDDILNALRLNYSNNANFWNTFLCLRTTFLCLYYSIFFGVAYGVQRYHHNSLVARIKAGATP